MEFQNNLEINFLLARLNELQQKQQDFFKEINDLRAKIINLQERQHSENKTTITPVTVAPVIKQPEPKFANTYVPKQPDKKPSSFQVPKFGGTEWEKLIGENLASKIGIIILVIGVAIGTKYAIDRQLINPLMRIILGYAASVILLGFALKLKRNYLNFSAVLISGALAIAYFITFFAYSYYELFSQIFAYVLMLIFTASAVYVSLNYNKSIIAHIGLVGAYAVPFLLSNHSGKPENLFMYMTFINLGILIISLKKYWKSLYFSALVITWLIFSFWYFSDFDNSKTATALIFGFIFFFIFYCTFLAYKAIKKEQFYFYDIVLLLANSFIFYGISYDVLHNHLTGKNLSGLFTLGFAIVYFIGAAVFYFRKNSDKKIFYLNFGLGILFLTIAIPVQFDGNWITLLWTGEAALMFWIGKNKKDVVYEKISYPLMLLAFISLCIDWSNHSERAIPFLNVYFFTSLLFVAAFALINYLILGYW